MNTSAPTASSDSADSGCWTSELHAWLESIARGAGFDAARVAEVPGPDEPAAEPEAGRFDAWIAAGHAGEMEYLKRRDADGALLRANLRRAMPWARSVVVCAFNYNAAAPRSIDPAPDGTAWIARYAWSGRTLDDGTMATNDYHEELLRRLRTVEGALQQRAACTTRCYVDTGPIVERSFAAQAGIGWIGKNTCVLNQQLGSWLLLGVIVTSLPLRDGSGEAAAATLPAADRCGSCTRCIDACPTGALLGSRDAAAPREMDASRCIAYLTIEKKGAIDEPLRSLMGRQVFGCDICQDVCPWNRRAPVTSHDGMAPRRELINPALEVLAGMDGREFKRRFKGSPLERTGRKRLLRNVAIAMGNSGDMRFLPQLDDWANNAGPDPVIDQPIDTTLRETAAWARTRIRALSSSQDAESTKP